jgi:hypothetical protein
MPQSDLAHWQKMGLEAFALAHLLLLAAGLENT